MGIKEKLKRFYETHFKGHCPDCGGVLQVEMLDMVFDTLVYKCRECGKEWV